MFSRRMRNREKYRGSATGHALRPDPPAMMIHDALNRGQSDAGARKLRGIMQTLEGFEKRACMGHLEAGAVILDREDRVGAESLRPELNSRIRRPARDLPA